MSRKSRSIRTLPIDNLSLLNYPLPEAPSEKFYFGEQIVKENSPIFERTHHHFLSSDDEDDSLENIAIGIRDLGNNSSSSSLSWGDDLNKSETSKQVRDELERMDRVLRGIEPIPEHYDAEEYAEWMEFFPNLCNCSVLGTTIKIPDNLQTINGCPPVNYGEEIVEEDCDNRIEMCLNDIENNHIIEGGEMLHKPCSVNRDRFDLDNYLKISPLGVDFPSHHRPTTRTLMSSQISSSKWLKDETEFNSLPFLRNSVKKVRSSRERTEKPKGILKNGGVVLPPIEKSNHVRSISATPRRVNKSLSALSVQGRRQETPRSTFTKSRFRGRCEDLL